MRSENRVAIVTGSSQRIGAAIVTHLHTLGVDTLIHYHHSEQRARQLTQQLNERRADSAIAVAADLAHQDSAELLRRAAIARWGRIDILVNNASTYYPTPIDTLATHQWDDLFASNCRAPLFLCQACKPHLQQSQGSIVNIVDIHAMRPLREHSIYCAAKSALISITKSLALELAPTIRVNGVAPGAILWPQNPALEDGAKQAAIIDSIPMKRTGNPLDIAEMIAYLTLQATYVTGQIIAIDGGQSI